MFSQSTSTSSASQNAPVLSIPRTSPSLNTMCVSPSPVIHHRRNDGITRHNNNNNNNNIMQTSSVAHVDPVQNQPEEGIFCRIQDAIDAVPNGGCVRIRPGIYQESVIITKPLTLIGAGEREAVVVRSENLTTLTVDIAESLEDSEMQTKIENITFKNDFPQDSAACDCIALFSKNIHISHCAISCRSKTGVSLFDGAVAVIRNSIIHDAGGSGVFVHRHSAVDLLQTEIRGHQRAGVVLLDNSLAVVSQSLIHGCKRQAIRAIQNSHVHVEDSALFENEAEGVFEQMESQADLVKVRTTAPLHLSSTFSNDLNTGFNYELQSSVYGAQW